MRVEHAADERRQLVGQFALRLTEMLEEDFDVALVDAQLVGQGHRSCRHGGRLARGFHEAFAGGVC
jgi:hypothetical protein